MNVLPLPPRPSLEQYKKRAKDLVKAATSKEPGAVRAWATQWLESLAALLGIADGPPFQELLHQAIAELEARVRAKAADSKVTLADAQYLVATAHGFDTWAEFAGHLERPFRGTPEGREFEAAVDAVVTGDLPPLESLLRRDPALVRAHSARTHRATLLHYVSANGVEDYRQKTPPNAVAIATLLLVAGADVDALADTYGGGTAQTTMNLLVSSTHPAEAGVQGALVETLLDFGAAINGLEDDASPLVTALAFGYTEAAETLGRRGARVDNILAAAGLGRSHLVASLVTENGTLRAGVPLVGPAWWRLPPDPKVHLELALVWASRFGRIEVVELLLQRGVDPAAKDVDAMTGLHQAAAGRHLNVVKVLVARGAPLEARNRWGGTVLDSTVWFALHDRDPGRYIAVLKTLIAGGADVGAVTPFPTGNKQIDDVLRLS